MSIELLKHQETLSELLRKIAEKNRELSILCDTKVEQYDARVGEYRNKMEALKDEFTRLETIIKQKREQADADYDSEVLACKEARKNLEAEYAKKFSILSDKTGELAELDTRLKEKESYLTAKEYTIEQDKQDISRRERELSDRISKAEQDLTNRRNKIISDEQTAIDRLSSATAKESKAEAIRVDLSEALDFCTHKTEEAKKVIERLNEVEGTLEKTRQIDSASRKREERLNEMQIKLMADNRRNAIKEDVLFQQEKTLRKREENLKLAEASLLKEQ